MSTSNIPIITVEDFSKIIEMQFQEKNFRPIFGLGKGGIGKTESIMHLAKDKLKVGYVDVRLLLYNETDLKGIPYPDENHVKTVWLQNNILPTKEKDGETGILVFDEITSCARSVRTAAYQLLNERRLGEYELPDGWMIVCLGNGEEDGGDYQGMEGNFANRCSVFEVVTDVETWKKWAMKNGINELVTGYVSFKSDDLHSYKPDSETELLFSSPRSWKAVSDILNVHGYSDKDSITHSRILGNLGTRVGNQFIAFCQFKDSTVNPEDILLGNPIGTIEQQEVLYITLSTVIKLVGDSIVKDIHNNNNQITIETLQKTANAIRWILSLKKEHAVMAIRDLISYDEATMQSVLLSAGFRNACPELLAFASENKTIFE